MFYRFICVPASHTADLISEILYEVLGDWNLESRLSITLDNCSSNHKLMENLLGRMLDKLPIDTLMLNGTYALLCTYFESNCERWNDCPRQNC